jgi:hypothetical protein
MEPEGSLPCLQDTAADLCPEPEESNQLPTLFLWDSL